MGTEKSQLVILRGTSISLYTLENGRQYHILTCPLFGIGRGIETLHIQGVFFCFRWRIDYYKDLLVISSDSGCLSIVEYDNEKNAMKCIYLYKYGRPGCVSDTPGQYLRISPDYHYICVCMSWGNVSSS